MLASKLRIAALLGMGALAASLGCAEKRSHSDVQHSSTGLRGRLIVAGGATKAENEEVYSRFMATLPADAVVGVIPTASGVPEESAASSAATLKRYAGSRKVQIIDISIKNPGRASDPAFVKQIEECRGLWFTGGDQSRIIAEFRPAGKDTPGYAAAMHVLDSGGVIGGTSAGAAMMSDPMIIGGSSEDALSGKFRSDTGDSGFDVGKGMGFFPFGLTDQHFLRRGRFGRLIVALERTGLSHGYGIEENCALEVDRQTGRLTALGPTPAVVVVDTSQAKLAKGSHRNIRVSLLCDGDWVDATSNTVHPHESRKPLRPSGEVRSRPVLEAWAAGSLAEAIQALAAAPNDRVFLASKGFTVSVSADERTKFLSDDRAPAQITALDVRIDITAQAK